MNGIIKAIMEPIVYGFATSEADDAVPFMSTQHNFNIIIIPFKVVHIAYSQVLLLICMINSFTVLLLIELVSAVGHP